MRFDSTARLSEQAGRVRDGITDLSRPVDDLAADLSSSLRALRDHVDSLQAETGEFALRTNAALNQLRVTRREQVKRLEHELGLKVAMLVVGFAGIVMLMALQMRLIAAVSRKLAKLATRNRAVAKRARAASRAKSTFLASMSHEIRTPLNGIIGTAEVMAHSDLSPGRTRHLSMIRESGYHLLGVITDVLDFSKLEPGRVDFEQRRALLPEIRETLVAMLAPRAEIKGLRLEVDLPPLKVGTDPGRLRQVLVNLAGNAIKFTAEGSVVVRGWPVKPDRLRMEATDTGIGIPEEAMPLLFRDFSQVDGSASRSFGGSGLGLAISRRVVEGLGGRNGVASRAGQGSTFWFGLPVTRDGLAQVLTDAGLRAADAVSSMPLRPRNLSGTRRPPRSTSTRASSRRSSRRSASTPSPPCSRTSWPRPASSRPRWRPPATSGMSRASTRGCTASRGRPPPWA